MREQVEVLEDHPDLGPLARDLALVQLVELAARLAVADQLAVDRQPAGVDLLQVVDAAQERRLARARRTEHAHHLAAVDLEVDALQHLEAPEALVDALGLDHRLAHHVPRRIAERRSQRARIVARSARREAAPEAALDEVLPDVEHARHREVPDARDDQQRDRLVVDVVDRAGPRTAARRTTPRRDRSEVFLSIEIVSLPVGGMITRIACGSTIRRMICSRRHAERLRGLGLALVDRDDAGADDLRHVGALVEAERRAAPRRTA